MQTYKELKVDYVFERAKFPKGGGAIFPRKYAPQGGQISYEFWPGGAKVGGGGISWDTGILYGMFYIVYNKDLQI